MRALLTNDDGVLAPGIAAMQAVVAREAETTVVAPSSARSANAHAITVGLPIAVTRVHAHEQFHAFAVEGQPADCVKLALRELMPAPPDVVISGINDGANIGVNVLYSGTIAAAAEGAFFGLPAFAVSYERSGHMRFDRAAELAWGIIKSLLKAPLSPGYLVSINIPVLREGVPRGVRVVPQSTTALEDSFRKSTDAQGRTAYHLEGVYGDLSGEADTDVHAVGEGFIAVTPLQFDLTDRRELAALAGIRWSLPA
jgi:5'-nucleotidase